MDKQYREQANTLNPLPANASQVVTTADSPYYDKYQLRPYNPSVLYQHKDYDVFDDMREDDQIGPMLTLKKQIVLNSEWDIECEDENIKEFIEWNLRNYLDDSFTRKLFDILSALDYGFSVTEKIFSLCDTKEYGQKIAISGLKTRAPHSFELHTDDYGNVFNVLQHTGSGDKNINPEKVIIYSYRKEFDNPYGNADLNKGVYRAWWAKDAIIKFWNIYLERFSSPLTIGKIQKAAGEGDKNAFKSVLRDISAKTAITIPDGFDVEFLKGDGSAGEFEAAIDKYNMMISRALLIPDLLGFSGSKTGGGSLALGKEQFNIFYTTIEYIRNDIQLLANREIIKPLVAMNFGNQYEAKFVFKPVDDEKRMTDFNSWLQAVNTGKIPVLDKHVNWALKMVNAPEIDDDEFNEIEKQKQEIAEQMKPKDEPVKENPMPEKKPEAEDKIDDKEKDKVEPEEEEKDNVLNVYAFERPMTSAEKRSNVKQIDKDINEKEETWNKKLGDIFQIAINGVLEDIKRTKIIEKKKISKVNELKIRNMRQVNKTVENMIKDVYDYGKASVPFKTFDLEGEEILTWFGEYSWYVSDSEGVYILKTIKPIILDAIRTGKSYNEAAKMAKQALDSYNMAVDGNRIKTTVRTVIAKSFNEARKEQFDAIGDEIVAYEYSAIMDKRTSPICTRLDGKIFRPEELNKYNPPNHFNCRSLVIPIFKDEVTENFKFDTMPVTEIKSGDFLELK